MKLFRLKSVGIPLTLLLLAITFRCELNAESKSQPLIHYIKPVPATCIRSIDSNTIRDIDDLFTGKDEVLRTAVR